jgi:hypothetical protein
MYQRIGQTFKISNMKLKKIIYLFLIIISGKSFASVPQEFLFQAVVRNASGQIQANKAIKTQVSIHVGSLNGDVLYTETHTITTSADGLATMKVGKGVPAANSNFASLDFATNNFFLRCRVDINGGNNFVLLSAVQLMSVPYAFHAEIVDSVRTPFRNSFSNVVNKSNLDENSTNDVTLSGNQNISGVKNFTQPIKVPTPVNANDAANLQYLEQLKLPLHLIKLQLSLLQ